MENREIRTFESKINSSIVTVVGKPNMEVWAKKVKQVLDDLEAGRYKSEEAV